MGDLLGSEDGGKDHISVLENMGDEMGDRGVFGAGEEGCSLT